MSSEPREVRIAGDAGGTFTDLVLVHESSGEVHMTKVRTTPQNPAEGFLIGVDRLLAEAGESPEHVGQVLFASTSAINSVLERSGAKIGLLVTRGFRHLVEIARANIPGRLTNELTYVRPERLVPIERIFEVTERCDAGGNVTVPLDEDAARDAIRRLLSQGVESIAVCLLHSYANPAHEQRLRELIAEQDPDKLVSLSSDIVPEYREYERAITTVLNAYVMPVMDRTLRNITRELETRGVRAPLGTVRCDGGIMSTDAAIQTPINTALSGPASGVYGAAFVARQAGFENVISLDMGGTSTDVSLMSGGRARIRGDAMISEFPVKIPVMDIETIGAGGGSIAYRSNTGALHVGPRSAGAVPGPVAYDQGGEEVTVTDANLVLGRLPTHLVGGELTLNRDKAWDAMQRLAREVQMDPIDLAHGILTIVNEKMRGAIRVVSIQRGYDPRDFVLIPFGGAGPVHSGELTRLLGITRSLIPPSPGVLSAVGALASDVTGVFGRTWIEMVDDLEADFANDMLDDLAGQATTWLADEGIAPANRSLLVSANLRYAGQASEIAAPSSTRWNPETMAATVDAFHTEHRRLYGFDWRDLVPVELVGFRVTAIGRVKKPQTRPATTAATTADDALAGQREVYFDGVARSTPIYDRSRLGEGMRLTGPAVIEQFDCTTVVLPGQMVSVDEHQNLIVEETK